MRSENSTSSAPVDRELELNVDGEAVSGNLSSYLGNFNSFPYGHDSFIPSIPEHSYPHPSTFEYSTDDDEHEEGDGDVEMSDSDGGVPLYEEGIGDLEDESDDTPPPDTWNAADWASVPITSNSHTYNYYVLPHVPSYHAPNMTSAPADVGVSVSVTEAGTIEAPGPTPTPMPPPPPHADLVLGVPPFSHSLHSGAAMSHGHSVANPGYHDQSAHVSAFSQHLQELQNDEEDEHLSIGHMHPNGVLGSENHPLVTFLKVWARPNRYARDYSRRLRAPSMAKISHLMDTKVKRVEYNDLQGDMYDFQGIDWDDLGVTRNDARERRLNMYKNFVNRVGSDAFNHFENDATIQPCTGGENYFRFQKMEIRQNINLAHFQLRNVLASTSRNRSFYPGRDGVIQMNPISGKTEMAMDSSCLSGGGIISTLAASHGVLVAGTFQGEYCLRNLDSDDRTQTDGQITDNISGITTHVQVHESRTSSAPLAAFACNDKWFRVLDVTTQKFISETKYDEPINCAVLSPDKRLRAMVGDDTRVFITHAETGEVLQELEGHRDYGFACDWADDGYTVATGFQDMGIKIWDARRWKNLRGESTPLCTIRAEMSGVRSMRFSPAGSGRKVLVAAEESDIVNIIDASDFSSKQTFDMFGEIGGVAFTNQGQDLQVLCCDRDRGGLLQLERWDLAPRPEELGAGSRVRRQGYRMRGSSYDRPSRHGFDWREAVEEDPLSRRPKHPFQVSPYMEAIIPF